MNDHRCNIVSALFPNLDGQVGKGIYLTAVAWTTTPTMKTPVAMMILIFREYCSARNPDSKVPTQAPNSKMDVSQPLRV